MVLPRELRLRGRLVFDRLYQQGRRVHGSWMVLRVMPGQPELLKADPRDPDRTGDRVAVVVSNKVSKKAVQRNRLRRLLHLQLSSTLQGRPDAGAGQWLLLSLKPGCADADPGLLLGECAELLARAGLVP